MSDREDNLIVLKSMASSTSGLTRTERMAADYAIEHLLNDDINMCKRILDMIRINCANTHEIREFCENYIKAKEEELNG